MDPEHAFQILLGGYDYASLVAAWDYEALQQVAKKLMALERGLSVATCSSEDLVGWW
jgi:hypothetical protein